MTSQTPLLTGQTRVWIIEGRAGPDNEPSYESQMRMDAASQSFGEESIVEMPDPRNYDRFEEVATIKGSSERVSTSLESLYMRDLRSKMLTLAQRGCPFDIQLHGGACSDPQVFNDFEKAVLFEKASLSDWATESLGSLNSDNRAEIPETSEISSKNIYECLPLGVQKLASSTITTEMIDAVYCDGISCGDCDDPSDGVSKAYAISKAEGGSPSTPADIVFTDDAWETTYAHDIESLGASDDPDAIDCVGNYVVIVSNSTGSIHYALKSDFKNGGDPDFTESSLGVITGAEPNDIYSLGRKAFVVGDAGYVYKTTDPTVGLTVVDGGEATTDNLKRVHAINEDFAVAVGENGSIVWTKNGSTWSTATTSPVGIGVTLQTVFVKSESEWWVGADNGSLYYTLDKGETWNEKAFSGSGAGEVNDIVFATDSIAYLSHTTATPAGRILRSYDGGYSWRVLPEGTGTIPANDRINRLATPSDAVLQDAANCVLGAGLADDGADGILLYGQAV